MTELARPSTGGLALLPKALAHGNRGSAGTLWPLRGSHREDLQAGGPV